MLAPAALSDVLIKFFNGIDPYLHDGSEDSATETSARVWRDGLRDCCIGISPGSTTVAAAADSLYDLLRLPGGFMLFIPNMSLFATQVGSGMVNHVATPPPLPLILGSSTGVAEVDASVIAGQFVAWMQTGTAVTQFGTTLSWS